MGRHLSATARALGLLSVVFAVAPMTAGVAGASTSDPQITLYGAAGTFGGLDGTSRLGTGHSFKAEAIDGWGFRPGQSAYFPAVAPDGTVLIANEPQTDNQAMPTAREMVVSAYEPTAKRFRNILIPTDRGRTELGGRWPAASSIVGGADVSDIEAVDVAGETRIAFTSAMPFWGWDGADGTFPTLGFLKRQAGGDWEPDAPSSVAASDIRANSGAQPCQTRQTADGGQFGDCHMPAEFSQLPASKDLVVTQYGYDDPSRTSGRISVLGAGGQVRATYGYPSIVLAGGERVAVHPREVEVDPLGRSGDERFVVIFDALVGEGTAGARLAPFALQELRYDAARGTIAPTSLPVLSGAISGGVALGFETAQFDARGNLWAAQARTGSLSGGPLAIFHRRTGSASVLGERGGCAAAPGWDGSGWGTTCAPDESVDQASSLGIARDLSADPLTGSMVLATMSGYLLPITPEPGSPNHRAGRPVDLGLNELIDRNQYAVGPRKGAVDPRTRTLWLPIQQLATSATCASWPCPPRRLDQWLARIDIAAVLDPGAADAAGPPSAPVAGPTLSSGALPPPGARVTPVSPISRPAPSAQATKRPVAAARPKPPPRPSFALSRQGRVVKVRVNSSGGQSALRVVWQQLRGTRWHTTAADTLKLSTLGRRRWTLAPGRRRIRLEARRASSPWTSLRIVRPSSAARTRSRTTAR